MTHPIAVITRTRNHKWIYDPDPRPVYNPDTGNSERKRTCQLCGMTRITVIPPQSPPFPWHEWKMKNGTQWAHETTPVCVGENGVGAR